MLELYTDSCVRTVHCNIVSLDLDSIEIVLSVILHQTIIVLFR
jgi:hypothetical protein